jgi:hypothetical protein
MGELSNVGDFLINIFVINQIEGFRATFGGFYLGLSVNFFKFLKEKLRK